MICPVCGNKHTDDTKKETTEKPNLCPDCQKKMRNKTIKIQCVIDCGPNGLSKQDGVYILDQLTKLFIGRGLSPIDIDFLEQYVWMEVPIKEDIKKLQEAGILHK
jgi:hypothetical protein